jgi:hypothetical protein
VLHTPSRGNCRLDLHLHAAPPPAGWRRKPLCGALALALCGLGAVQAQTAPDAGRLMQQNQPPKPAVLPKRSDTKELSAAPATMNLPSGTTVSVKRFAFKGNTLLDEATL